MPENRTFQNLNQVGQTQNRGKLDAQINAGSGVIAGEISSTEEGSPKAGDWVKLDPAGTSPLPQFLLCDTDEEAFGVIIFDSKKNTLVAGDGVNVAFKDGIVTVAVANEAVTPGEALEQNANGNMQALDEGSQRGIALDPASAGGIAFRMIKKTAPAAA